MNFSEPVDGEFSVQPRADGDLDLVFRFGAMRSYVHMTGPEAVSAGLALVKYGMGLANAPMSEGGN